MGTIKPESKMLEEVRRWRREAYEARRGRSFEELDREDRALLERLGLFHLLEEGPDKSLSDVRPRPPICGP